MTGVVEMIFQWYYLQDKVDNRLVYTMLCFGTQLLKKVVCNCVQIFEPGSSSLTDDKHIIREKQYKMLLSIVGI